ncbi:MAG: hypothetical protein AAF399_16110 [Bacteroidota bacterium]
MQHLILLSLRLFLLALIAAAIGCTPAYEMQQTAYNPDQPRWGEPEPPAEQLQQAYRAPASATPQSPPPTTDGIPQQATQRTQSDYFALFPETPASSYTASTGSPTAAPTRAFSLPTQPTTPSGTTQTNVVVDRAVLMNMRNTIDALLAAQETNSGQSLAALNQPTARQPRQQPPATTIPQPAPTYAQQDPNKMMQQQLQERIQQAPAQQPSFLDEESFFEAPAPATPTYLVPVFLASGQTIQLDEKLLREWEAAILASKRGEPSFVELPAWLMKGLEMLTHAPTEEPARSQTIMPLYRELESAGYLRNVNLNNMTSRQVVAVLRFLVDDVKRNQGRLNRQ